MKKLLFCLIFVFSVNCAFAEKIIFSANSMSGQTGNSASTTSLSGNAYIKTDSMEIQADLIELSGDDYRNILARGKVNGKNLETHMDFTCDELSYDRETRIATLQGNVNLKDTENDVTAQAQIIEYNQDTDIAILQIKINLTQKDNVCSGSYAVYHKKEQLLEISGNAQVKQKEDVFRAQHITLDMDTQDITLGGNVKGTVTDSKKEETPSSNIEEVPADNTPPMEVTPAENENAVQGGEDKSGEEMAVEVKGDKMEGENPEIETDEKTETAAENVSEGA